MAVRHQAIIWANVDAHLCRHIELRPNRGEHGDVIKWKPFPRYWPFVRGIHRSPVNSPHKGQGCGALMFSLICTRLNGWVNNGEAGDLRRYRAHYDATVMIRHYSCDHVNPHLPKKPSVSRTRVSRIVFTVTLDGSVTSAAIVFNLDYHVNRCIPDVKHIPT